MHHHHSIRRSHPVWNHILKAIGESREPHAMHLDGLCVSAATAYHQTCSSDWTSFPDSGPCPRGCQVRSLIPLPDGGVGFVSFPFSLQCARLCASPRRESSALGSAVAPTPAVSGNRDDKQWRSDQPCRRPKSSAQPGRQHEAGGRLSLAASSRQRSTEH